MEPERGGCSWGIRTVSFSYAQTWHRCARCPSDAVRAERTQVTTALVVVLLCSLLRSERAAAFLCHVTAAAGGAALLSVPLQAPGEGR